MLRIKGFFVGKNNCQKPCPFFSHISHTRQTCNFPIISKLGSTFKRAYHYFICVKRGAMHVSAVLQEVRRGLWDSDDGWWAAWPGCWELISGGLKELLSTEPSPHPLDLLLIFQLWGSQMPWKTIVSSSSRKVVAGVCCCSKILCSFSQPLSSFILWASSHSAQFLCCLCGVSLAIARQHSQSTASLRTPLTVNLILFPTWAVSVPLMHFCLHDWLPLWINLIRQHVCSHRRHQRKTLEYFRVFGNQAPVGSDHIMDLGKITWSIMDSSCTWSLCRLTS